MKTFRDANLAYSDFINKLTGVINSIAPMKQRKMKNNSQEWFDGEVAEKIAIRDKLFQKFFLFLSITQSYKKKKD